MLIVAKKKTLIICLAFFCYSIDRLSKLFFYHNQEKSWVLIKNILNLQYTGNQGMVFGLLVNEYLYYFLLIICLAFLIYLLQDSIKKNLIAVYFCLNFIIIGAVSNLIDRLRFGAVIDFIDVPFWSVFNLADIFILFGVIIWIIIILKNGEQKISKKSREFYL